jgi:hypothetical protein
MSLTSDETRNSDDWSGVYGSDWDMSRQRVNDYNNERRRLNKHYYTDV